MACYEIKTPTWNAIICGDPRSLPKVCAFCGDPAEFLCDWPMLKKRSVQAKNLKPGDVMVFSEKRQFVLSLAQSTGFDQKTHIEFTIDSGIRKALAIPMNGYYQILSKGTCDKPVCYRHTRQVDEGRDYCQDHWQQQEIA